VDFHIEKLIQKVVIFMNCTKRRHYPHHFIYLANGIYGSSWM